MWSFRMNVREASYWWNVESQIKHRHEYPLCVLYCEMMRWDLFLYCTPKQWESGRHEAWFIAIWHVTCNQGIDWHTDYMYAMLKVKISFKIDVADLCQQGSSTSLKCMDVQKVIIKLFFTPRAGRRQWITAATGWNISKAKFDSLSASCNFSVNFSPSFHKIHTAFSRFWIN